MSPRRRRRRILLTLVALLLVAGVAVALTLAQMSRQDAEHARFYDTGASVKGFLGRYCGALREASASGGMAPLEGYYAEEFQAADGGRWTYAEAASEGGVRIQELRQTGSGGVGKAERRSALADYLDLSIVLAERATSGRLRE